MLEELKKRLETVLSEYKALSKTKASSSSNSISDSVGRGGANVPTDVTLVQTLLNQKLGLSLSTDGQSGPKTVAAIEQFQKSIFNGWSDGKIDAGGTTWQRLSSSAAVNPNNGGGNSGTPTAAGSKRSLLAKGQLIFHVPSTEGSYPLLIVFGGVAWATPTYMEGAMPKNYFSQAIIVFAPLEYGAASAEAAVNQQLANMKGYTIANKSVFGFSGGARSVKKSSMSSYKVVGFIDPEVVGGDENRGYGSNVIFSYNRANWGIPVVLAAFPHVETAVKKAGGTIDKPAGVSHKAYPAYFFNTFKGKIL